MPTRGAEAAHDTSYAAGKSSRVPRRDILTFPTGYTRGGQRVVHGLFAPDVRNAQRVRNVVRKRLTAGVWLGMDMNGDHGVCHGRAGKCDDPGKLHTAATGCTTPELLYNSPCSHYQRRVAECLCADIGGAACHGVGVSISASLISLVQVWVSSPSQTSHMCDMRCVVGYKV